jgi:signal transduction histidine kinase
VLSVADRGPGFPLDERAHIFSRFYRGTSQHAVRTRGAGVGLAVVRELVDRMGATVSVSDTPGGGATFTVAFLPASTNGDSP